MDTDALPHHEDARTTTYGHVMMGDLIYLEDHAEAQGRTLGIGLLHADGTSTPEVVDEKFSGRVVARANDRDQVMHPQSSCWRRKRSNSAARSSALGMLDSARRS